MRLVVIEDPRASVSASSPEEDVSRKAGFSEVSLDDTLHGVFVFDDEYDWEFSRAGR